MTLLFEDGTSAVETYVSARAVVADQCRSRPGLRGGGDGRRFGAVIESTGTTPAQIVVERAMYGNAGGVSWAAGTNALATKLQ